MAGNNDERGAVRLYLLGQLTDEQQQQFEQRLILEDQLLEELEIEEEAEDLLQSIQQGLRRRERGNAVRLEVAGDPPAGSLAKLVKAFKLDADRDVYPVTGMLNGQAFAAADAACARYAGRRDRALQRPRHRSTRSALGA